MAGDDVPGLTLALRLRMKGHDVVVHNMTRHRTPAEIFTVVAPYRDLFLKSGGPLETGITQVHTPLTRNLAGAVVEFPSVGAQHPAIEQALGREAADAWRALLADAADMWAAVRTGTHMPRHSFRRLLRVRLASPTLRALAESFLPTPGRFSDAGVVFPYLVQTFGCWQFDGGMTAFESTLRARCVDRGVRFDVDSAPRSALSLDDFYTTMFSAPRRVLVRRQDIETHTLGLPFIGMAAEAIAERIGRA